MPEISIAIATPMYGSQCHGQHRDAMIQFEHKLNQEHIGRVYVSEYQESLIPRGRNRLAYKFRNDEQCKLATHFLFVDADIWFNAEDMLRMVKDYSHLDVIGATYAKKAFAWDAVRLGVQAGCSDEELKALATDININWLGAEGDKVTLQIESPMPVKRVPTGLMLIRRETLETVAAKFPEHNYVGTADDSCQGEIHSFFNMPIDPVSRELLSEDWAFCDDVRACGMSIWLAGWVRSVHYGLHGYPCDLAKTIEIAKRLQIQAQQAVSLEHTLIGES